MAVDKIPVSSSGRRALDVAKEAATIGARILIDRFRIQREITVKGRGNLVSDADFLSQAGILEVLNREYPQCSVITEEATRPARTSHYTWVVDPLDGTNNYVFGVPFFCVNIALVAGNESLVGVTYDPNRHEMFSGEKGKGAFLNDTSLAVSKRITLQSALIGSDLGYSETRGSETLDIINTIWPGVHALRLMGSAALGLAYVAAGRLDLYFHRFLYPWDIAPGIMMIREAGGTVTDWRGGPANFESQSLIASSNLVHEEFALRACPVIGEEWQKA
jgi:myo-inositol-1(or 4)-monophosphatase